jgi:phosphomannomutase
MGMLLVEMVATCKQTLGEMLDGLMAAPDVGIFRYGRVDRPVRPFKKADLVAGLMSNVPAALADVSVMDVSSRDGVKFILADDSWLLIRPSGTEPVLRIYAEGRTDEQVSALLSLGGELAEAQINILEAVRA